MDPAMGQVISVHPLTFGFFRYIFTLFFFIPLGFPSIFLTNFYFSRAMRATLTTHHIIFDLIIFFEKLTRIGAAVK